MHKLPGNVGAVVILGDVRIVEAPPVLNSEIAIFQFMITNNKSVLRYSYKNNRQQRTVLRYTHDLVILINMYTSATVFNNAFKR